MVHCMNLIVPESAAGRVYIPQEDIDTWRDLFASAERRIKEIEHGNEGLDIPAINELRYAGFHLLEVLKHGNTNSVHERQKVTAHIKRAIYDASEALIGIQLKDICKFQDDYRLVVVAEVIPEYQKLMESAEAASELVRGPHKDHDNRDCYYEEALKYVDELKRVNRILRAGRQELNKRLEIKRQTSRRWAIGLAVGAISAAFTAVIRLFG